MPGHRQSIDDLFESEAPTTDAPAVIPPRPAVSAPPADAKAAPVRPPSRSQPADRPSRRGPRTTGVTESQTPKWQRLERKELRLRADQLDELARVRRTLNRQRGGEGERITENTLIRVAVDLLLKQAGALKGSTEDELRNSVTS
jgi:RNA polymerase-interacting CarD/CdnL/TRCF family regulator